MRTLSVEEVLELHRRIVQQSGGSVGLRDRGALESAVAQPLQTFEAVELYEGVIVKAAALAFFIASNHPFIDGNKRAAHAAFEVTLILNGYEIEASIDEQERIMLSLASGKVSREALTEWAKRHTRPVSV